MSDKLEAETAPTFMVGPVFDPSKPGEFDALQRWMIEQHVGLCAKGGVDCKTCKRASEMGIALPA